MSAVVFIDEYPSLLDINVGLGAAIPLFLPLLAEFDVMLTGTFGLGAVAAELSLQLAAAISVQLQLTLAISDPFASILALLQAVVQLQASLSASLSLAVPTLTIGAQISASVALAAQLAIKLEGINLLIQAALAIKIPVVDIIAELNAALNAGPFDLLGIGYAGTATLESAGAEFAVMAAGGVGTILPTDQVWGVIVLTKASSASASLSVILKTS
jgi:hypothetical protein